ncbi:MAG TPA: DUF4242 domain-containing protein [Flavisolibacter sp.]|jgi:hypothetical protein|nr:DUF4242 domain-containing protein [Flavisolibacter sp.]
MKQYTQKHILLVAFLFFAAFSAMAQTDKKSANDASLRTYLIEREISGAGMLTPADLKAVSQKSCTVLKDMKGIQWVHSYVTGNKIVCVYKAANEELIREHGKKGGFPVTSITEVNTTISPETAN